MNRLEQAAKNLLDYFDIDDCGILFDSHMEALREALAEQAEQEGKRNETRTSSTTGVGSFGSSKT